MVCNSMSWLSTDVFCFIAGITPRKVVGLVKSEESLDSGDIRQELDQMHQTVEHLDKQVMTVSQDVNSLRSDVKTILHLLQTAKTIPVDHVTGLSTLIPNNVSVRAQPQNSLPTTGILKNSSGERTPPVNRVGFVDRPGDKDGTSRCHSCENVRTCNYGNEAIQRSPLLESPRTGGGASTLSNRRPFSAYSPVLPRQNSNGALRTAERKVVRIKDLDECSTPSSTRGDSGIDMEKECETDRSPFPKVMSTDL